MTNYLNKVSQFTVLERGVLLFNRDFIIQWLRTLYLKMRLSFWYCRLFLKSDLQISNF